MHNSQYEPFIDYQKLRQWAESEGYNYRSLAIEIGISKELMRFIFRGERHITDRTLYALVTEKDINIRDITNDFYLEHFDK